MTRLDKTEGRADSRRKARLRRTMRKDLAKLEEVEKATAARALEQRVLSLPEIVSARRLLACLSFGVEIETRGLIERLHGLGKEVLLPRIEPEHSRLTLHRWPCPMQRLPFGLEQPAAKVAAAPEEPVEIALILGLAFDRERFRLGHGGGYFDRWLEDRSTLPIGLAYEAQIVDRLPRERHDIPMAIVVTDGAVYRRERELKRGAENAG